MWKGAVLINVLEGGLEVKCLSQEANVTRVLLTRLRRGAAIVNTAVEYGSDRLELRRCDGDLASPCGRQTCIQHV